MSRVTVTVYGIIWSGRSPTLDIHFRSYKTDVGAETRVVRRPSDDAIRQTVKFPVGGVEDQ